MKAIVINYPSIKEINQDLSDLNIYPDVPMDEYANALIYSVKNLDGAQSYLWNISNMPSMKTKKFDYVIVVKTPLIVAINGDANIITLNDWHVGNLDEEQLDTSVRFNKNCYCALEVVDDRTCVGLIKLSEEE